MSVGASLAHGDVVRCLNNRANREKPVRLLALKLSSHEPHTCANLTPGCPMFLRAEGSLILGAICAMVFLVINPTVAGTVAVHNC